MSLRTDSTELRPRRAAAAGDCRGRAAERSPSGPALAVHGLHWPRAVWLLLVVLCGALFLDGLDISMIGVALPSIGSGLHMAPRTLQWVVSGYVLGYGGLLLLGGRASDLFGRRRVFLAAVAVFGIASVASSLVSTDGLLIALRFVKGVCAAFTVPAGLSIITTTFAEGSARNRALSIYSGVGACGYSSGLIFGGLLTELGWRTTFLVPGPVAIALVLIGWRVIPRSSQPRTAFADLDLAGALASTAALLVLVYAVVEAPQRGWGSPLTIGLLLLSVALAVSFWVIESRHRRPLVRLGILRSRALLHANFAGAAMFGGYVGFQFLATLYLQDSLGWSPLTMALAFLPAGLIVLFSALKVEKVLGRLPDPVTIMVGLFALVAGYLLFLRVEPSLSYWNFLFPTIVLVGIGFSLGFPAINSLATTGVTHHEQGLASGLVNTSFQIGGAIVLAVVSALIGDTASVSPERGHVLPGMTAATILIVAVSATGALVTGLRVTGRRPIR